MSNQYNEQLIQITAGRGPAECTWVVARVLKVLLAEARNEGLEAEVISRQEGQENGTLQSAAVKLRGKNLKDFLDDWEGTVQWIGRSPFRKFHKRKNWFVSVQRIHDPGAHLTLQDREVRYEATRSGGPGGQHVNKVSTAVRATHLPTGLSVLASDHRSQHQNRQAARKRLEMALQEEKLKEQQAKLQENWLNQIEVERGNAIRTFEGTDFRPRHKASKKRQRRTADKQAWKKDIEEL
ncbi:peptide chain release factor H [Roseivirga sp. BDSF3-8]|uniref:peptide chain release factor H n=1 Tax=Roseivirga sp. BDSF3-8 TaxID=3241598 RepID=UPI0035321705